MQISKKELKAIVAEAVEAVALAAIRNEHLPYKDERDSIVQRIVEKHYRLKNAEPVDNRQNRSQDHAN